MPTMTFTVFYWQMLIAQAEALLKRETDDGCFNVVNTIVLDELSPETLGSLMAMYENKTAILGALLGINTFDQPGVELGKLLAKKLLYLNFDSLQIAEILGNVRS